MKIYYRSKIIRWFFPSWVRGFAFGQQVFIRGSKEGTPQRLINHETIHAYQYKEYGIVKFLWIYFWKERKLLYRDKTFEKEAYAYEDNLDYIKQKYS